MCTDDRYAFWRHSSRHSWRQLKLLSHLRFDYDTTTIRRYHDAFDYDESDRNYDMRSFRLPYDYDTTTTKNRHVHFLIASNHGNGSRRARCVVVGSQSYRSCNHGINNCDISISIIVISIPVIMIIRADAANPLKLAVYCGLSPAEATDREPAGERVTMRELKSQMSTLSTTSTDAMFSAPGPMQTSTPGIHTCNHAPVCRSVSK